MRSTPARRAANVIGTSSSRTPSRGLVELRSSPSSPSRSSSTSRTASTTRRTRSRRASRRGAVAARRRRERGPPQLRRRLRLDRGRGDGREGHRRSRRDHARVVLAGLVGAITWNLITWYFGLPSSSSHALIGGVLGSALAATRARRRPVEAARREGADPVARRAVPRRSRRPPRSCSRILWIVRTAVAGPGEPGLPAAPARLGRFVAFTHGTNDAQKTMGIIALALVAAGHLDADDSTVAALGDRRARRSRWRARHVRRRLADHQDARDRGSRSSTRREGFAAQTSSATILWLDGALRLPVSTTHTISGSVLGAGMRRGGSSAVRWGVAGNILVAWVMTIPAPRWSERRWSS